MQAQVIAPGVALISVVDKPIVDEQEDPVCAAFLAFLAQDMAAHPEHIVPMSDTLINEALALIEGVSVTDDETLPDDVTL